MDVCPSDVGPAGEGLTLLLAEWSLSEPVLVREGLRARVYRCRRSGADREAVILKRITASPALGFNDWASLEFLNGMPTAEGLAPRFLMGSVEQSVYLIEDLGGSDSLETRLNESDRGQVAAAFETLAAVYGRLHRATRGGETRFLAIRVRYPDAEGLGRVVELERWLAGRERVDAWIAALGVKPPAGLDDALHRVGAAYADPGPFLTFTHGDPAPTNNHVRDGVVRLLDFEYGAFRHALYDLTAWEVLCPLPRQIVRSMQRAWRQVVGKGWPEAADAAAFREGWAAMCAFRALAMLTWVSPDVLERNRAWVGKWTAREALGTAISRLAQACAGVEWLAPVQDLGESAENALLRRFPELEGALPRWAAFSELE